MTGFISHGFEDFTLFDPSCPPWLTIWLEYGGTQKSGTIYCCGDSDSRSRPEQLVIEDIPIPLLEDGYFRDFDRLLHSGPDRLLHATLRGRFFAGELQQFRDGSSSYRGYGHMGCCSLFAIQQVISVDPQNRGDVDYRAFAEQPDTTNIKVGCGYGDLEPMEPFALIAKAQQQADSGKPGWVFDDSRRVATEELARLIKIDASDIQLKQKQASPARVIYEWEPSTGETKYMMVVSRPYLATFYARDKNKIAWIVTAAYRLGCDNESDD